MKKKYIVGLFLVLTVIAPLLTFAATPDEVPRMSKEELRSRLGHEGIVVIDVRTGRDWEKSGFKIKGAVREDPRDVGSWAGNYDKGRTIVLYCA